MMRGVRSCVAGGRCCVRRGWDVASASGVLMVCAFAGVGRGDGYSVRFHGGSLVSFMVYLYCFVCLLLWATGARCAFMGGIGGCAIMGVGGIVSVGSEVGVVVSRRRVATTTFTRDVNMTRTAVSRALNSQGGCPDASFVVHLRRGCGRVDLS